MTETLSPYIVHKLRAALQELIQEVEHDFTERKAKYELVALVKAKTVLRETAP